MDEKDTQTLFIVLHFHVNECHHNSLLSTGWFQEWIQA